MFKSFRWRLTGTYLLIITGVMLAFALLASITFKNFYLNDVKSNLIYEAVLVKEMINHYNPAGHEINKFQEICNISSEDTDNRVTIISGDGKVLGDSNFDAATMENHAARPEVYQALHGNIGAEIRFSDTAGTQMFYVAIPFDNGEVKGALRLAKPLNEIEALYKNIIFILLFAIAITALLAFALSIAVADRFARPLKHVTEVVKAMSRGNLQRRISVQGEDELGILSGAVNDMAENLETYINELHEVSNRLQALLGNTVNGIVMVDRENRLNYANPAAISLLGLDPGFMGKKYVEAIKNFELIEVIDKVRKSAYPIKKEVALRSGGEKAIELNVVPIMDKKGDTTWDILAVLNDITELKRLEQVRKDFVANVSHELKTPVATISGFAETMMSESRDMPRNIQEFSGIIYDEAQRLSKLINKLLTLSKLESTRFVLNVEKLDVAELIDTAINIMKKRFRSEEININYTGSGKNVYVNADGELIMQVILNLLDNAVSHSPAGEEITVEVEDEINLIKVSITDHGEGIPAKDIPRIFERFYRVDKDRSRKTGGTGLGLSIVKHLVENHHGQVGVDSQIGRGSIFYFTLPKQE